MRTIIINLSRSVRLSDEMAKMREWLDAQRCSPSNFGCDLGPETLTFWVEFSNEGQAEAFREHYAGRGAVYLAGAGSDFALAQRRDRMAPADARAQQQ